jgi:hypothetical protein
LRASRARHAHPSAQRHHRAPCRALSAAQHVHGHVDRNQVVAAALHHGHAVSPAALQVSAAQHGQLYHDLDLDLDLDQQNHLQR